MYNQEFKYNGYIFNRSLKTFVIIANSYHILEDSPLFNSSVLFNILVYLKCWNEESCTNI